MIVRGPGIDSGKTTDHITLNIDLVSLKMHQIKLIINIEHTDPNIS